MATTPRTPVLIDPLDQPLTKEQKTFNTRMRQLDKLRDTLAAWERASLACQQRYTTDLVPLLDRMFELDLATVHALDRAAGFPGLSKTDRRQLQELLCDLAASLLEEYDDPALKDIYNRHAGDGADYDAEQAERIDDMKDAIESMLGIDLGDDDDMASMDDLVARLRERMAAETAQAQHGEARHPSEEPGGRQAGQRGQRRKNARQLEREAQAAAEAQAGDRSLRDIYRKLASALHPDREPDPDERARKTALMQRINQAYDRRDLLQLLELQLELEHIDRAGIARLSAERLRHYNAILKQQIDGLKQEVAHAEMDFRMRFDIDPYVRLTPASALPVMERDIIDLRRAIARHEHDLARMGDPKGLKAVLKEMREMERAARALDAMFPPF